jgi:hypothetical protein
MARACGRTIRITAQAFRIRIVRSPTESDISCLPGVPQDVLQVSVRYLEILAADDPEPRDSQTVLAKGDPERLLASQIAQGMDSREFSPSSRIVPETDDLGRLASQTAPEDREGNQDSPAPDLVTRVQRRGRRIGPRSTGSKQVPVTVRRSNVTVATLALAIAPSRAMQLLRSNVLLNRHGPRHSHAQLPARDSRRNAEWRGEEISLWSRTKIQARSQRS